MINIMMRKNLAILVLSVGLILQSCVKNDTQPSDNTDIKVQDLTIPPGFEWEMSKSITCTVNSAVSAPVGIYLDKECTDEQSLARFITNEGKESVTSLSIPVDATKLYLKYTSATGTDKVVEQAIHSNKITFNIADAAVQAVAFGTKTDNVPVTNKNWCTEYPAGWGTVLFEDLFPSMGDYDFNDFVASYLIVLEYPWKNGGYDTEHTKQIRVQLRLRAIGGSLNYTPYVRIKGLNREIVSLPDPPYGDASYVNPKILNNTTDGVKVDLVNSDLTSDAIIEFKNLNPNNPFRVAGDAYFNCTPGYIMKVLNITEVDVYLEFSEEMKVSDLLDDKIDIFLASADKTQEIHLRGFYPVFSEYDFNKAGLHPSIPYATDKNLVWGIKVPQGQQFLHVVEKTNFCAAYKDFAGWVTSGGATNPDWYKTNLVKENLIEWAK